MSEPRDTATRRADVLAALERNQDMWLATAGGDRPHLIAVSSWWDGEQLTITTRAGSRTARNLEASRRARLGLGSPEDLIVIDATLSESSDAAAAPELAEGFAGGAGWDPREEPGEWSFYRLRPERIEAYRGYAELAGRVVMREGRWL